MHNKKPLYILFGAVLGICISLTLTCSYAKITRIKTIPEHIKYMEKHEKGLTLKKLDKRITKIETKVDKLERSK